MLAIWIAFQTTNGEKLVDLAEAENIQLVFSAKQKCKKYILRGRRKHVPFWSETNQLLYEDYVENGRSPTKSEMERSHYKSKLLNNL